ncbi:MAG: hypothetical protein RR998_01260 [Oscillospiraceae bacterium]
MKKLLVGAVLLVCAGFVAFFVKDMIDRQHPEYAVTQLTVTADTKDVAVIVAGFDWAFPFGGRAKREAADIVEQYPVPSVLLGGEKLELIFSQPIISLSVRRSESYSYALSDIGGDLTVPFENGAYLYEVNASFEQGSVLYYFYILVE